jgi:fatty-acyl-CoA synthase
MIGLPVLLMRRMLDSPEFTAEHAPNLRLIYTGGEPVPVELLQALGDRLPDCSIYQIYGMTEFPASAIFLRPEFAATKLGSVGKAGLLTELRVVDDELRDRGVDEVGEIVIRSSCSALGYWNRPEATAEAFAGGWYRTGDLGRLDADGFLFIVGREKDIIISGGLNIYAAEVEQVLGRHAAIAEIAVVGIADDRWGQTPVAVVVLKDDVALEDLRAHADEHLAKFKRPHHWVIREEPLPRTVSGKIKKFQVLEELPPLRA